MARSLVALAAFPMLATMNQVEEPDYLALGIRQYEGADYEKAVFSLDAAVRQLTGEAERTPELVQAYVYLGAAYIELENEAIARGKFHQAVRLDPDLTLSTQEFPRKVLLVFEAARGTAFAASFGEPGADKPEVADGAADVGDASGTRKKGGSKVVPILLGVGAAGGVGLAVAAGGGGGSSDGGGVGGAAPAPAATPTPTPEPTPEPSSGSEIVILGIQPSSGSSLVYGEDEITVTVDVRFNGGVGQDGREGQSGVHNLWLGCRHPWSQASGSCYAGSSEPFWLEIGEATGPITVRLEAFPEACPEPPFEMYGIAIGLHRAADGGTPMLENHEDFRWFVVAP